tara:strand:+ start:684 stop:1433 length:750 start_codon:yes stop_codon:yes gene_type:complete
MKILSGHQPQFIPWLGFFSKISTSDTFVFLDDFKYSKLSLQTRNRIRSKNNRDNMDWLILPVVKKTTIDSFHKVKIDMSKPWKKKHLKSLKYSYQSSKYFDDIFTDIDKIYNNFNDDSLIGFLNNFINYGLDVFKIKTKILFNSEIKKSGSISENQKAKYLCDLTKKIDHDAFLFGSNAGKYFDRDSEDYFKKEKIIPLFQDYVHPEFKHCHDSFVPGCSFLDMLFNVGKKDSYELLERSNFKTLKIQK